MELSQSLLKLPFFRRHPARQNKGDFQVQSPKLVDGHQLKIVRFHVVHILQNRLAALSRGGRSELRVGQSGQLLLLCGRNGCAMEWRTP